MNETVKFTASDGVGGDAFGDLFGSSISIHGDRVLVGAFEDEKGKGSAYIFQLIEPSLFPHWRIFDR